MAPSYINSAAQIMERGRNNNSYKFALLRSLAAYHLEPGNGAAIIKKHWLAEKFVNFFWPITIHFQLRQATVPDKDPVVMKYLRSEASALNLSPELPLKKFCEEHPDRYKKIIEIVSEEAFDDVIPRFHTVPGQTIEPKLYEFDNRGITITSDFRTFIKENNKALDQLAIGAWVKFTEKYTSAPRIYEKIQGLKPKRSALKPYRDFFLDQGETQCFYCSNPLKKTPEVDHVVPWSFIAEDKVWNLVLACNNCNGMNGKSNRTPTDKFIKKLELRNDDILAINVAKLPPRIRKDLAEWRGQELKKNVQMLVERCRADGFDIWHQI